MSDTAHFETFDLTIHLGPNQVPWLSASSKIGLLHGIPRDDPGMPTLDDLLDLVHDYRDSVQYAESNGAAELSGHLDKLVFGDPQILELFQATRGCAAMLGRPLLVRVLPSPHLSTLPWELLPDPAARNQSSRANFLTMAPDAHVVRLARGRSYTTRATILKPPLNLLIVLASPSPRASSDEDLAFDIYEVKRNLLNELQPLVDEGLLRIDVEDRPTLENLRRCIGGRSGGYQLFHYVGHALPESLVLEDASGRRLDQDSSSVCEVLRLCPDLRLAVFAGCETARAAIDPSDISTRRAVGGRDLISLADRCVQDACPVVIGMQALLPFRTERLFTRFFYQGVASGYSVAESLQLARGATRSDTRVAPQLLDWSVPALYVGAGEPGPLIDRNVEARRPVPPKRYQLRVDLAQRETRFFARDLPLRQAVDVLASRTPERVLVVTGGAGVGKSYLVDRAIEEVGAAASHVLYAKLGRFVPGIDRVLASLREGSNYWEHSLENLAINQPLQSLCELVWVLLKQAEDRPQVEPDEDADKWWETLVEEISKRKFALVLDEFDQFDEVAERCIAGWLRLKLEMKFPPGALAAEHQAPLDDALEALRNYNGRSDKPLQESEFIRNLMQDLELPAMASWITRAFVRALEPEILARLEEGASKRARDRKNRRPGSSQAVQIAMFLSKLQDLRQCLENALKKVASRRSSRVAIVTTNSSHDFLGLKSRERFDLRLGHLTWQETWRWIRRNLPGLTRFNEQDLAKIWVAFGPELERWEALEREVLITRQPNQPLSELVDKVAPSSRDRAPQILSPDQLPRRGRRPLRIATAGQLIKSTPDFVEAISRLANRHGIGGRLSTGSMGGTGTLGELVGPISPLVENVNVTDEAMLEWLEGTLDTQPDIVLLDYGAEPHKKAGVFRYKAQHEVISAAKGRCLFIAAAGNDGADIISEPGNYPEVLTVGAVDEECVIRAFSGWAPRIGKPDIFMQDDLSGSELASALTLKHVLGAEEEIRMLGTSFSALHATAGAILAWSLLPDLRPSDIRQIIVEAGKPSLAKQPAHVHLAPGAPGPRCVNLEDIVKRARMKLIEKLLLDGACVPEALAAMSGLDTIYIRETLAEMIGAPDSKILRTLSGRLERFELR